MTPHNFKRKQGGMVGLAIYKCTKCGEIELTTGNTKYCEEKLDKERE